MDCFLLLSFLKLNRAFVTQRCLFSEAVVEDFDVVEDIPSVQNWLLLSTLNLSTSESQYLTTFLSPF